MLDQKIINRFLKNHIGILVIAILPAIALFSLK